MQNLETESLDREGNYYFDLEMIRIQTSENRDSSLAQYQIFEKNDPDLLGLREILTKRDGKYNLAALSLEANKSLAVMLGAALGDALGAQFDAEPLDHKRQWLRTGWTDLEEAQQQQPVRERAVPLGLISEGFAHAKCVADALLSNNFGQNAQDLQCRYLLCWYFGYCNGSTNSKTRNLAPDIAQLIQSLQKNGQLSSENCCEPLSSALARNAPVPIAFLHDRNSLLEYSDFQANSTTQWIESN